MDDVNIVINQEIDNIVIVAEENVGPPGLSAYQVALLNGFVGTEANWLLSLKGNDGDPGTPGAAGSNGTNGTNGSNGLSAYQIAVNGGFIGDQASWLLSLKGDPGTAGTNGTNGAAGTNGTNGSNGATGADGISAYQVAVNNGFIGNQAAWLLSIKGDKGDKGDTGNTGATGSTGLTGATGPAGITLKGSFDITLNLGEFSKSLVVNDSNVLTGSVLMFSIFPTSRDLDEIEFVNFQITYGNIINATSFEFLVSDTNEAAEGTYTVKYIII